MFCACDEDGKFHLYLVEPIPGARYIRGEDWNVQRRKDEELIVRIRARKAEIEANRRVPCQCEDTLAFIATGKRRRRPAS